MTPYSPIFLRSIAFVLKQEGGLSDHKNDAGGRTNYGVTVAFQGKYLERLGKSVDELTRDEAIAIHYADKWLRIRGDELPEPVAFVMFDFAVNSGAAAAVKTLQRCLGFRGDDVDGKFGPMTLEALHGRLGISGKAANILAISIHVRRTRFVFGDLVADNAKAMERGEHVPATRRYWHFAEGWAVRMVRVAFELGKMLHADPSPYLEQPPAGPDERLEGVA